MARRAPGRLLLPGPSQDLTTVKLEAGARRQPGSKREAIFVRPDRPSTGRKEECLKQEMWRIEFIEMAKDEAKEGAGYMDGKMDISWYFLCIYIWLYYYCYWWYWLGYYFFISPPWVSVFLVEYFGTVLIGSIYRNRGQIYCPLFSPWVTLLSLR